MSLYVQDQYQDQYSFLLPTEEILKKIESLIDLSQIVPWVNRTSWFSGAYGLGASGGPIGITQKNKVEIGKLYWPTWGASRWGFFLGLMSEAQAQLLMTAAYGEDGTEQNKFTLKMNALGQMSGESISVQMYSLPTIPLLRMPQNQVNPLNADNVSEVSDWFNGVHLIVLVDPRYYLQWTTSQSMPDIDITAPNQVSWNDLIDACVTDMSITINNLEDLEVSENYLYPDITMNLYGENAAIVLDSICSNIGCRLVALLDGTFNINQFLDAQIALNTDWNEGFEANRTILAGGQGLLQAEGVFGYSSILPANLIMTNQTRLCNGFPTTTAYPSKIQTTAYLEDNEDYEDFDLAAGLSSGFMPIRDTCLALLASPTADTPSNQTQLDALAQQIFNDWCNWKSFTFDITWNGVCNIGLSGLEDWIIWTYIDGNCRTREISPPLTGMDSSEYNHQDGDNLANCQDNPPNFTDGSPGFNYVGADGVSVFNATLQDGRFLSNYIGEV